MGAGGMAAFAPMQPFQIAATLHAKRKPYIALRLRPKVYQSLGLAAGWAYVAKSAQGARVHRLHPGRQGGD